MQTRVLGGEQGRRGFFGGSRAKGRSTGLMIVGGVTCVLVIYLQLVGLLIGAVAAGVVLLATMQSDAGSLAGAWRRKRAWRERRRRGTTLFRPVRDRPDPQLLDGEGKTQSRVWASYRDAPDGMDGFAWLQQCPGTPGIAWHAPTGEEAWLSVVWAVAGQVRGIRTDEFLERGMDAFGRFLARYGSAAALPGRVQLVTRALPVDATAHQAWVFNAMDPTAPEELVASYADLVDSVAASSLTQRHFVVVRWPLTARFRDAAAARGPGLAGWRLLMADEIAAVSQHVAGAMLGQSQVLSARGVAALLRHLQHPSWPVDQVGDVDVTCPWWSSEEQWDHVAVVGPDPSGVQREWVHRSAVVPIDAVETSPRTPLWFAPLLAQLREPIVRTVSVQIELQPAREARTLARGDMTTDLADLQAQTEKGVLTSDELLVSHHAADQRLMDLRPGSGHAGAGWVMHVQVSAASTQELVSACTKVVAAAEDAGITRLGWLDGEQAAAAACTWPVARGMRPIGSTMSGRLRDVVARRAGASGQVVA